MAHAQLAAQLYTVRDYTKTAADLRRTLERVKAIGYTAVQISAIGPIPSAEVKAMVSDIDLAICNTHIPYDRLKNELPAVIEEHRIWNCRHVAIGSLPPDFRRAGAAGFRAFAKEAEAIGGQLRDAGLTFGYHNHAFEFEHFPETPGTALDLLLSETDPAKVQMELDVYWVQFGGGDPSAWIRKVQRRMPVIHLKDMTMRGREQLMAEVGEGNLNWPAILEACRATGVEWYAVEQDICQRDPFESLAISYRNLHGWGLR